MEPRRRVRGRGRAWGACQTAAQQGGCGMLGTGVRRPSRVSCGAAPSPTPPHPAASLQRHPCADRVTHDDEVRLATRRQLALEEAGDVVDLRRQSRGLRATGLPRACYVQT